jgi:release factor glutamine methyltransferase
VNAGEAIIEAAGRLAAAGIEEPRREAAALLAHVLGRDRTFLFAHPEYELLESEECGYHQAVARRSSHEPFHYITGTKEFYGLDFRVAPGVLIPRPETEILVDEAIAVMRQCRPGERFLEIGTGTGCISIAVVKNAPDAGAICVDVSPDALEIARTNAARHNVADRVDFRLGDVYKPVDGVFPLIVSNPPYIPMTDRGSLAADVVDFEPETALFGGPDGLDVVRRIIAGAGSRLSPGGHLLMEIGAGQAAAVRGLLVEAGLVDVVFLLDLQRIERVASARSRNSCI